MFSSIRNDPARLRKEAEMSSYQNRYFLCTPGPGIDVPVPDDVHVRLQAWGGNWATNRMDVENDLRGQTRRNNRDRTVEGGSDYHSFAAAPQQALFPKRSDPFVEESRASMPAWMFRGVEIPRWEEPWINPQSLSAIEKPFPANVDTKRMARDAFQSQQ
jgi:hypothetical protein